MGTENLHINDPMAQNRLLCAEKFEKQKLKFILLRFGNPHCYHRRQRVEVDGVVRMLCEHQLQMWHSQMADAARLFFGA